MHAPPGATTPLPQSNHACPPPSNHACPPRATTHAPSRATMHAPPRSNHACPPGSNHTRANYPGRLVYSRQRLLNYYLVSSELANSVNYGVNKLIQKWAQSHFVTAIVIRKRKTIAIVDTTWINSSFFHNKVVDKFIEFDDKTRMHSSRMRTGRS